MKTLLKTLLVVGTLALLASCSTLAVKTPDGMTFLSTGDYTPGVKTLGLVQSKTTVFVPILFTDANGIKQALYNELLAKAKAAGATGVTNITSSNNISILSIFFADFYMEGWAIVDK